MGSNSLGKQQKGKGAILSLISLDTMQLQDTAAVKAPHFFEM